MTCANHKNTMNKERRNRLNQALEIVQGVASDEQTALESLPESLQQGERGEKMQSAIDALDAAEASIQEAVEA